MNVRSLCLAILHFGEQSGYDIKKMCTDGYFRHFVETSLASIYPTLAKLEDENLVTVRVEQQDGKPNRKIYALTDLGHDALLENLDEAPKPDKNISEFLLLMKCCHLLSPARVSALFDQRIAEVEQEIKKLETCMHEKQDDMRAGSQFCLGFGLAINQTIHKYLIENRKSVEQAADLGPLSQAAAE